MVTLFKHVLNGALAVGAFALLTGASAALADPPGRVARMSFVRGDVGFQPAGTSEWADAVINRPLVAGDRLATDSDSRVELEIGAGSIRLDERSTFSLLDIDDQITQVELTDGTLNISVRRLLDGQSYEVDTPTLAFVVSEPGDYRIDVAPDGDSTMVTVFEGRGDVYGENNASYRVREGQSYRFNDSGLRDYEVLDVPRADDFDRFCQERSRRYDSAVSSRYVSDELVGYADLDAYGSWSTVPTYGSVWYPRGVGSDWAPYRDGHWAWIDPWGWSWVDDQPWGFAPSHYGRWAQINSRWGWVPGPRQLRPVYAPALVAFVGGGNWGLSISSNPVGWFPLGPRDVYRPWYDCSRDYFTRVNTRNTVITNITVVNVYNDYSRGRPFRGDYAYRRDQRAFTAVPGDVFAGARPIGRSRLRVGADAFGRGNVVNVVAITPVQASLVARGTGRAHRGDAARFDRRVVARNTPPAAVLPFAQREAMIRENGNRSPGMDKLRGRADRADRGERGGRASNEPRILVVDRDAKATPRELPAAADRADNRGDRRVEGRADRADAVERNADGRATQRADRRGDDAADRNVDRRAEREKLRADADARETAGEALPSTRFSPSARERQARDQANGSERGGRGNADNDRQGRDARNVEGRQQTVDQQAEVREQRNERQGDERQAERDRAMAERQRANEDENTARQARQESANEQRRARQQAVEDRSRLKTPDAIDPPISLPPQRVQRQQRDDSGQRAAEQDRRNAIQQQRSQAMEQQRAAAGERLQAQEQQRAEQANRGQAEQMQRQQDQQNRQAQRQQQQMEMQQRQQQAQQQQMQQQQQQQQQNQQQQMREQQQVQQQQAAPQQQQRVERNQQKREAREEKDAEERKNDR